MKNTNGRNRKEEKSDESVERVNRKFVAGRRVPPVEAKDQSRWAGISTMRACRICAL